MLKEQKAQLQQDQVSRVATAPAADDLSSVSSIKYDPDREVDDGRHVVQ